ncbi:MAG: hypothetical protein JW719_09160 [Pirellulales bacterium]|nr:hypothetical protein [Pirellulales bacterium]
MDERENELLSHVAAGTDLFTAVTATERNRKPGWLTLILVGCVVAVIVYLLL